MKILEEMPSFRTYRLILLFLPLTFACFSNKSDFTPSDVYIHHRLVHLDLKGAPPRLSYYVSLIPFIARLGATGLLLEYEDMFPYHGPLKRLARRNAYSRTEIEALLALARQHRLEVVPLIQTFGHMEFVLKHRQFGSLREVWYEPYTICPSDNGTLYLIQAMIDQVLELHPEVKWIHIGCDEVYQLGKCTLCQERMRKLGIDRTRLFLNHVITVASYVRAAHSVKVIIWDDILQSISEHEIRKSGIAKYVVPMVWKYHRNVWNDLDPDLWEKYVQLFPRLWIASAFKGATGQTQQLTNLRHHFENHCSWMEVVRTYSNRTRFLGIALTGWQRYNHYTHLCELFPAGLPSLTLDLLYLRNGSDGNLDDILEQTTSTLGCSQRLELDHWDDDVDCVFPGSDVLKGVLKYKRIQRGLRYVAKVEHELNNLLKEGRRLREFVKRVFIEVFDNATVSEWLETYVEPLIKKIKDNVKRVSISDVNDASNRFKLNEEIERQ